MERGGEDSKGSAENSFQGQAPEITDCPGEDVQLERQHCGGKGLDSGWEHDDDGAGSSWNSGGDHALGELEHMFILLSDGLLVCNIIDDGSLYEYALFASTEELTFDYNRGTAAAEGTCVFLTFSSNAQVLRASVRNTLGVDGVRQPRGNGGMRNSAQADWKVGNDIKCRFGSRRSRRCGKVQYTLTRGRGIKRWRSGLGSRHTLATW